MVVLGMGLALDNFLSKFMFGPSWAKIALHH